MRGVTYVNDSKATNTAAAKRALASYPDRPLRVIMGGSLKGESFEPLAAAMGPNMRAVYLIGQAADDLEAALAGVVAVVRCGDLESAIERASREAERGRRRPAVAGLRELRPVPELRASRRGVPPSGAEPGGVKRAQLESNVLVLVTLALTAFGLVMVYSATSVRAADGNGQPMYYLTRQAIFAVVGIVVLVAAARTPYRVWKRFAPSLLLVSLTLLAGVLLIGSEVNGARRWVSFGSFNFQPSELAKLALAIWTATYLSGRSRPSTLKELGKPLGLVAGIACILVLVEPDLGTAIAIAVMLGGMLVVGGVPSGVLARSFSIVTGLGILAIWLEPYRRARVLSFLDPWKDPQGAGFQVVQSMIGLGSGGIFGVGIGHGVIKNFNLPEAHTDMIFATIGEELGLVGTTLRDRRVRRVCVGRVPHRPCLRRSVRQGARRRADGAGLRPGGDQPRRRDGDRAPDRDHPPVHLLRRVEPDRSARRHGHSP